MYQGLKKVGCKVIWGLKDFKNPAEGDDNFRVMGWLPQIEVLAHPACKAGLTHCGFGGALEFISMGIPVVAWPHFADQPVNANLLIDAGAGVMLCNKTRMSTEMAEQITYREKEFDSEKVYEVFSEILKNPRYKMGIDKLSLFSNTHGGLDLAVKTVENTYITGGVEHLLDRELMKRQSGFSCIRMYCCLIFWLGLLGTLIGFLVFFYMENQEMKSD